MMPKGVDHGLVWLPSYRATRVQKSLMPKGVDHTIWVAVVRKSDRCKNL